MYCTNQLANDIVGNLQTWDTFERNSRMVFASKEPFKYVHDHNIPIEKWPYRDVTLNVYFLYPNCIFLVDPAGVDMLKMYPDPKDPAKSKTYHTYYLRPALLDHLRKEGKTALEESRFLGFNKVVVDEDYAGGNNPGGRYVRSTGPLYLRQERTRIAALSQYAQRGFGTGALRAIDELNRRVSGGMVWRRVVFDGNGIGVARSR